MKKIFTLIAFMATAFTVMAKDYTSTMSISLNGENPTEQEATISAVRSEEGDNIYYEIVLKQFSFSSLLIGDVTISGVGADDTDGMGGYSFFHETTKEATITNGAEIAAMLGNKVTVTIKEGSCINDEDLYLDINLPVNIMGGTINVDATFGENPNETKSYTDDLNVSLEGNAFPTQQATINVTKQYNGKYTLSLNNFELTGMMAVGTIEMADVDATEENGIVKLSTSQQVTIKEGDDPDKEWSMAGQTLPVELNGELTDEKLYAEISINLGIATVNVVFGEKISAGISNTVAAGDGAEAVYDISGRKLNGMQKGLNIVRKADGTTVKIMRK